MAKSTSRNSKAMTGTAPATAEGDAIARLAEQRIAIEGISTEIDGGRFPARAVAGRPFVIEADIFSDGHDVVAAAIAHGENFAQFAPMTLVENDRWRGEITLPEPGLARYTLIAWRDLFAAWRRDVEKKLIAKQDVALETIEGRRLVEHAVAARPGTGGTAERSARLEALHAGLASASDEAALELLLDDELFALMKELGSRTNLTRYFRDLEVFVDPPLAAFGAWYEMMPRSQGAPGEHGTFSDVIDRLPYVEDLGFDVLYFTPIHPIGRTNRKGRNNTLTPAEDDPGSPYAIGSEEGGHDALHPELGTIEDFDRLVAAARGHGLEIALDFAIQCSPDHPWIKEHPEWFDWRPDGSIKFAENPPKKYEDIVNVHFYRDAIPGLWLALRNVVEFWISHGVKIFRVDNPHTKPFPFWEWMIGDIRSRHPETIFLAEAFTRPKVMKRLAKIGFNQSYSYFTWRNEKWEIEEYLTELTQDQCREYMRPNFFPNTPDINPYYLQQNGRAGFRIRLALAATLGGNYGLYNGYEICDAAALPGKEEYFDSEKYQLRQWDMDAPGNIKDDIRLMNRLRREHPALSNFTSLRFYTAWNDQVLSYMKSDAEAGSYLLFHVSLDAHNAQEFDFEIPFWEFGLPDDASIEVQDAIHGNRFTWHGKTQRLRLDPAERPYAVWRLFPPGTPRG